MISSAPFDLNNLHDDLNFTSEDQVKFFRKLLFKFCIFGLSAFVDKELHKLDPHVGDTSCQIRACIWIWMFKNNPFNQRVEYYKSFMSHLDDFLENASDMDVLSKNHLPFDVFILGISYFLTVFRISDCFGGGKAIDFRRVSSGLRISNTLSRRIIRLFQKELSKASCDFIIDLAAQINYRGHQILMKFKKEGDDGRFLLPCFFASEVIWFYLKAEKMPIALEFRDFYKMDKEFLLFNKSSISVPCFYMVCSGFTDFNVEEYSQDPFKMDCDFYVNQSVHPQYSGEKLRFVSKNPFEGLPKEDRETYEELESYFLKLASMKPKFEVSHIKSIFISPGNPTEKHAFPELKIFEKPACFGERNEY